MSNNTTGGKLAAKTNMERHGSDFYKKIGAIGGTKSRHGGFASEKVGKDGLTGKERARLAGKKGGSATKNND